MPDKDNKSTDGESKTDSEGSSSHETEDDRPTSQPENPGVKHRSTDGTEIRPDGSTIRAPRQE